MKARNVVGLTEYVKIDGNPNLIPAKIDTGARTTAVSASILEADETHVKFILFCEEDEFYDGTVHEGALQGSVRVRSSNGHIQKRLKVVMPIEIGGKKFETEVNLSDRSKNTYPILIGAKTLQDGGFLVDPTMNAIKLPQKNFNTEP